MVLLLDNFIHNYRKINKSFSPFFHIYDIINRVLLVLLYTILESDKMYDIKKAIINKKKSIAELTAINNAPPDYHADNLLIEWKKELAELQRIEAIK